VVCVPICVCVGGWLTVNGFLSNFNSWDFSTDVTPISSAISPNLSQVLSRASCSVTSSSTVVTHPEEYYTFLSALSFKVRISYFLHIFKEKIPRLDWLFIDSKLRALPECKLPKLLFIFTIPENSGNSYWSLRSLFPNFERKYFYDTPDINLSKFISLYQY